MKMYQKMRIIQYRPNLNYKNIFLNNMIHVTEYLCNLHNLANKQDKSYNKFLQHCIQYMMCKEIMNKYYNSKNILINKYYFRLHNIWDS